MSSSEDTKRGDRDKPAKPPDLSLGSSFGLSNEPTQQAHTIVSQTQGDVSHPTSSVETQHGKLETDVQIPAEAHATMSQEYDISSLASDSELPEQKLTEEIQGEAELEGSAIDPESPETEQPPVSTAAQAPATTTTSNLTQTAPTMATTTTTQSVATTNQAIPSTRLL